MLEQHMQSAMAKIKEIRSKKGPPFQELFVIEKDSDISCSWRW